MPPNCRIYIKSDINSRDARATKLRASQIHRTKRTAHQYRITCLRCRPALIDSYFFRHTASRLAFLSGSGSHSLSLSALLSISLGVAPECRRQRQPQMHTCDSDSDERPKRRAAKRTAAEKNDNSQPRWPHEQQHKTST